jgi:transposase
LSKLGLVSGKPGPGDAAGEQHSLLARLRAVIEAKDAENATLRAALAGLRAELDAEHELVRRLELRVAELERRLRMDSSDSGTPTSKEPVGAKEQRRAERRRQHSERERRKDRKPGGQPGHPGTGLSRDPDPDERKDAGPPVQCSRCGTNLAGALDAGSSWAQVVDVSIARKVTEWLLPMLRCSCCRAVTTAAPPGAHAGTVSYGPVLNAAAILLASYGNVPPERSAHLIRMLLGVPVSAGFVDKANARLSGRLEAAGFDDAMQAALAGEPALAADESPVNVLTTDADPDTGEPGTGAPHVLVIRTPAERLVWLQALTSRRAEGIVALLSFFTGFLITDGYTAYQQLLPALAGIQQCCQHIIRRCRAVTKLGPGAAQAWAGDVITTLRQAHAAVEDARSRGQPAVDANLLKEIRDRYDQAVALGIILNRLRDWDGDGNHPGYALGCWLRDHADQVWLFTSEFAVEWTSNSAERAVKGPKRHQAVSGYWHTQATLARWCRIRSYLESAANHGLTALDAISTALAGKPWLPAARPFITAAT